MKQPRTTVRRNRALAVGGAIAYALILLTLALVGLVLLPFDRYRDRKR